MPLAECLGHRPVCHDEGAADCHRRLDWSQAFLRPLHLGQPDRQVVQAESQVGQEGLGVCGGKLPVVLGCLLDGGERLLPLAYLRQPVGQVVETDGQVGQEGGVCRGEASVVAHRLPHEVERLVEPAQLGQAEGEIVDGRGQLGQIVVSAVLTQVPAAGG